MFKFSAQIDIEAGATLGGYGDRIHQRTSKSSTLELHGISGGGTKNWEVVAVDALYPGVLSKHTNGDLRVVAASHTHFAPLLDDDKPAMGLFSEIVAKNYLNAIDGSDRVQIEPDQCDIYSAEVDVPMYRRFDYPDNFFNRILTRYAGFFPNEKHLIDRSIKIFIFSGSEEPLFAIIYHACHPVSRSDSREVSADYIQTLRESVKSRFGTSTCLFFQGCAGDVRPNTAKKRVSWLPKSRLNWRFNYSPSMSDQSKIDEKYATAVRTAIKLQSFKVDTESIVVLEKKIKVDGLAELVIPELKVGEDTSFYFLPFEVSHRYHLDTLSNNSSRRQFIVSCSGNTKGYLPHPSQLRFGGYEVDSSRAAVNLKKRIQIKEMNL